MLKSGIDINNALKIMKIDKEFLNIIDLNFKNGIEIDEFILNNSDWRIKKYLLIFSKFLSFNKSLDFAIKIYDKKKKIKELFLKNTAYPIFLIFTILLFIYIFNNLFFDNISTMIYEISNININYLKFYLDLIFNIILIILLIMLIVLELFVNKKYSVFYYQKICNIFNKNFIKTYSTYNFMIYYLECLKQGLSNKETINILMTIKGETIVNLIAKNLDDNLILGKNYLNSFQTKLIDKRLCDFINISIYSKNNLDVIASFLNLCENEFNKKLIKISVFLQAFAYMLVFICVYLVYKVLLIPLNIIGGL